MQAVAVVLWGERVGALTWDDVSKLASFEYDPDFIASGLQPAPLRVPLSRGVYRFVQHARSSTFRGLPGFIADSLPESFGNRLLDAWLTRHGRRIDDLDPLERLCCVGRRGMGALEYQPDLDRGGLNEAIPLQVNVLAEALDQRSEAYASIEDDDIETLVKVGTSAGGASAKAVIAINDDGDVLSGQADVPPGYEHWLLKFDSIDNEEHAGNRQLGRIEYAYGEMAHVAGINTMPARLLEQGGRAHFMTQRFDRVDGNDRVHVVTLAGMSHADRDPPGNVGYERLFQVIRELGLSQTDLDEAWRRMVFNIVTRNQDDHTKNHAFLMFGDGSWQLAPAYDLCFSYLPGNAFMEQHQMSCNGRRDHHQRSDLRAAAKAADVKRPDDIIDEVLEATSRWGEFAQAAGIEEQRSAAIGESFRAF